MKSITSPHNQTLKNLKKLVSSAKARRQADRTILEGVHLCESYLERVGLPRQVIYTDRATEHAEAGEIIAQMAEKSVDSLLLSSANFRTISDVENGIEITFVIDTPKLITPEKLTKSALLLDGVQDPGNLGTILRTAAAADVGEVYLSPDSASAFSPKTLRAVMGAHFALNIYENVELAQLVEKPGLPIFATSLDASQSIYETDLTGPCAWIFGSEGSGVSQELLVRTTQKVIIPQNDKVESLNVAASVAICLFEQRRQNHAVRK